MAAEPGAPRRRALGAKLAALAFGLCVSLVVGEIGVRVLGLVSEPRQHLKPGIFVAEPALGWALQPNYRGAFLGYAYQAPTSTNPLGYRGPEWDAARRDAPLRVLVLGDSCTFGMGVGDDETYPAQLEAKLRESGRTAAVFNAGVPGYDTAQEHEVLQRLGPALRPHVVVLAWLPNDILQPSSVYVPRLKVIDGYLIEDQESYSDWRRSVDHAGIYSSALFRFLHTRRKLLGARARPRNIQLDAERLQAGQQAVADVQHDVERLGARMALVLFPREEEVDDPHISVAHHDAMAAFAEQRGIEVVHLARQWRARGGAAPWYLAGDQVHLNAQGYAQVADALVHLRTLQEAGAAPSAPARSPGSGAN